MGPRSRLSLTLFGAIALFTSVVGCSDDPQADPVDAVDAEGSAQGDGPAPDDTATDGTATDEVIYPGARWERADAAEEGFDPTALETIAADAEANHSNCLVVTRRGRIVADWYWNDTDADTAQEVFSVTKSFASTLVGIAVDRGELTLDEPASDHITDWVGTPSEQITVRNLVSNDSGRFWDFQHDFQELPAAADATRFAIDLEQTEPPGTRWVYNNSAIQTLDEVLLGATGVEPTDYAREHLLEPIGMDRSEMTTDRSGNTRMFMGLASTCEDLARFGYLFLRDGRWEGDQIISSDWVQAATAPSQDLRTDYGYLWWLNTPASPDDDHTQMAPGADPAMFAAQGMFGQTVLVDPETEIVITRIGQPAGSLGDPWGSRRAARIVTEALVDQTPTD